MDALDARLEAAGWTCSMVQDWKRWRRRGWTALWALRAVRAERAVTP